MMEYDEDLANSVLYSAKAINPEKELLLDSGDSSDLTLVLKTYRPFLFYFAIVLLSLSNVFLLALLLTMTHPGQTPSQKSWLPPEVMSKELFEFHPIFGSPPSEEAEEAWNVLMPVGRGFVSIKNDSVLPEQPGLNQSIPEPPAMVSVFHQLHCVYVTRRAYYSARAGNIDEVHGEHLSHCWDYLRQTIMCHSDTTLEWLRAPPNDTGSTGWGYEHTCRDFETIFHWAEENKWTNGNKFRTGIA